MFVISAMTGTMMLIHAAVAAASFKGKTVPRSVGYPVALYEIAFYEALLYSGAVSGLPLLLLTYLFLAVHVAGGLAYMGGALTRLYSPSRLAYYGLYELFELAYLSVVFFLAR
ncbi:MAG: hypothetical protein ACP5HQ_01660 [Thermoprotei archaeon]